MVQFRVQSAPFFVEREMLVNEHDELCGWVCMAPNGRMCAVCCVIVLRG